MPYADKQKKIQRDREYRQENLEKLRAYDRSRHRTGHRRRWIATHYVGLQGGYTLLRRMSVRRQCEMSISFDEYRRILEGKPCYYCGADLTHRRGHKLDRVENSRGYSTDNVVPCCARCNNIKGILERWGYKLPVLIDLVRLVKDGKYCPKGHAMSGDNLLVNAGKRYCLTCKRTSGRDSQRRHRARLRDPRPRD